ncbi:hypothetical protein GCM10028791_00120 [Echinicola sediminis]
MNFFKGFLAFSGVMTVFLSCENKSERQQVNEDVKSKSFHLEIVDSIRLDYLGDLEITDVHPTSGEIVGFNFKTNDLIIFDQRGKIHQQYSRGGDRPNPINSMVSLGFYKEDKLLVANNYGDLAVFEKNGSHVEDIPLPFKIEFYNWTQRKKIYSISEDMLLGQISGGRSEGYREYYLDFIDLKDGSLTPVLPIPEISKYKDGQYYSSVYPFITKIGDLIYMLLKNEPSLHVYKINGMAIDYLRSVNFGGEEFVDIIPSENQASFQFDRNFKEMRPGEVESIFDIGGYLIAVYKNGIDADRYTEELADDPLRKAEMNPFYLSVFDKKQQLVNRSVKVPSKVRFIQAVMPDGKMLASKNKDLLGEEQDFETFYLMELVED